MMGWLFYDRIPANPEAEIRRICTAQDGTRTMTPVVIARDGMTWYAAVRVTFASAEYPTAASSPRVSNAARRMNGRCAQDSGVCKVYQCCVVLASRT